VLHLKKIAIVLFAVTLFLSASEFGNNSKTADIKPTDPNGYFKTM